jgi:membrane-bound lytic murein transglycosylase D
MRFLLTIFYLIVINTTFAQETLDSIKPVKISFLDSIKKTFIHDETAACVDASFINELTNKELFNELILDLENFDFETPINYDELPTELLKERLKILDAKSDFDIAYNPGLENVIKYYLKNRKKSTERLMGLAEYYFPLYESTLAKHNVPLEIKYLSIVESALNPKAVSRVGATGLWQFMYGTGKEYGLEIDTYYDERSDPIKSSEAACEYMKRMYKIFGDWDLCLASYNAGPGNVSKAIRRSGGKQNYWNIRPFLPKETQGYVPAFLATMYMFEFHKEHGLKPHKPVANLYATDTIMIKNKITFKQISQLLDISEEHIKFFNPIYKRDVIPYIKGKPLYLRLPVDKIAVFTSNEDKMYAYANYEFNKREKFNYKEKELVSRENSGDDNFKIIESVKYHKVNKNETLGSIASQYNVSQSEIKKWNGLRKSKLKRGANLKIITEERIALSTKTSDSINKNGETIVAKNSSEIEDFKTEEKTTYKKVERTKTHRVKKNETLSQIASAYNVTQAEIKKWNGLKKSSLNKGAKLKIITEETIAVKTRVVSPKIEKIIIEKPISEEDKKTNVVANSLNEEVKEEVQNINNTIITSTSENIDTTKELPILHIVSKGEVLNSIAKKYNVDVDSIKKYNKINKRGIYEGQKLMIFKYGSFNENNIDQKQIVEKEEKQSSINYHIVKKEETLYALSRKYNLSINQIKELNNLKRDELKVGERLLIQNDIETEAKSNSKETKRQKEIKKPKEIVYKVKKGDTLIKIANKHDNVSVEDLRKWNNLKNSEIQPGMKLKIKA